MAADLPTDWSVSPRIGLDCETYDPTLKTLGPAVRRGGFIAGISFALSENRGHYLPLRHLGGDNVADPRMALGYVKYQAKRFRGEVVGANLQYDLDFLAEAGIEFHPDATFRDVQVAEPLLDELQHSYSLDNILGRHGMEQKVEEVLRRAAQEFDIDPKADLWKLPARYVGAYAEGDATLPLKLLAKQEVELEAQGLWKVWDLESRVLPALVRMRRRGVRVDFDRLDRVERFSRAEEAKVWGEVMRMTGVSIAVGDAMKPEGLARALQAEGVSVPLTAKGKPSVTKELLETVPGNLGKLIRRGRQMSQLRSTFVSSIRNHAVGDRIHCTFNQMRKTKDDGSEDQGARYGRLSCSDPNLQQQPARDPEIGPMWRSIYVPDEGAEWGQLDYSQQEPRWAVHFGVASGAERIGLAGYRSACEAQRRYNTDRSTDAHTLFTSMVHGAHVLEWAEAAKNGDRDAAKKLKLLRDPAKNIYLGICYGEGGPKLCRDLGLPTKVIAHWKTGRQMEVAGDEGQALLDLVNERVPYVKKTAEAVERVAKERGFVRTVLGRKCRFETDQYGNYDWTYRAFNRVIQGSSADQTKAALVELDRAGYHIQLQVHDEFDGSFSSLAQAEAAAEIMEHCVPCHVNAKVDVGIGPSWGEVVE